MYQDTLVLAAHSKGRLALVYLDKPMLAFHFCHLISLFHLFLISDPIFKLLFGGLSKLCFIWILYAWKSPNFSFKRSWSHLIWSYGHWDITPKKKVTQSWKILWLFSWKIHIFQFEADIVERFWWKLAKTLFFKMVQPTCSNSCPIFIVYCAKSSKKLLVFFLEKKSEWFY